jgi:hypothetical protein
MENDTTKTTPGDRIVTLRYLGRDADIRVAWTDSDSDDTIIDSFILAMMGEGMTPERIERIVADVTDAMDNNG